MLGARHDFTSIAGAPAETDVQARQRVDITVLDLDRTLTRRGTYTPFLLHAALRSAPWRLLLVPAVLVWMAAYRLHLVSRRTLKERMQRLLLGKRISRARVDAFAASFAERVMANGLHDEALGLIASERAAGRTMILATAAHRFYAAALAARLGIADVVATESEWRGDWLHCAIVGENCYGDAKRDAILARLGALGLTRRNAHIRFFSDDGSDLPAFEASDERCVVNPNARLARLARERGWSLLQFR